MVGNALAEVVRRSSADVMMGRYVLKDEVGDGTADSELVPTCVALVSVVMVYAN